jgi:hypothetical protein
MEVSKVAAGIAGGGEEELAQVGPQAALERADAVLVDGDTVSLAAGIGRWVPLMDLHLESGPEQQLR